MNSLSYDILSSILHQSLITFKSHIYELQSLAVKSIHTNKDKNIRGLGKFIKLLKISNPP